MSTHAAREHSSSYNSDLDVSENEDILINKPLLKVSVNKYNSESWKSKIWHIYHLYVTKQHNECLSIIEDILKASNNHCKYPLYIKAMILRQNGEIEQSLEILRMVEKLDPTNIVNIKQIGRSLFLLGKHRSAIEVYDEALTLAGKDWEIYHNKGICYMFLKDYRKAIENFYKALEINNHDSTYTHLGKLLVQCGEYEEAIALYEQAITISPDNVDFLTVLGLLYLKKDDYPCAFNYIGRALSYDQTNSNGILVAGSILQNHYEFEGALMKYRICSVLNPDSPELWNNIGMCFYGKNKIIAAISCLKKALYLAPNEWKISFNLGLAHLKHEQYVSAFRFFTSSANLNPKFSDTYIWLGVTLNKLGDFENSKVAFEKGLMINGSNMVGFLNYAIVLSENNKHEDAKICLTRFKELYLQLTSDEKEDLDVIEMKTIGSSLGKKYNIYIDLDSLRDLRNQKD
ncbi:sporangia induced Bardet-Biedl syndrome 4 protein [Neocallimastix lanati (nom. inval.)]|jgi:Bardet-Biedl syndrome 4 protein|uniref:Sporangia induced Bardet-Biedl syndrome 4 protein n=1 Tax=Neocallimastix californiae TaxID=1754190 RepID=A0A1Y2DPB4_9FUNG|nr:sporangia induced Bardet-Biedl syndrome 4 protein [Neocallimastix sp. JGI-2020a]ORY61128.1 sporangia induced Bardet-Biedl syndrome 4 protein [Neocallimastix californiae]|eukprot:ORY61128.1 sporangia induced Bardet-Biedl syndrome 4 protein [Neocallimastix californiae]